MSGIISRLYHGEADIDFLGRKKLWFLLSGALIALSVALLVGRGLNYGIEFAGGVSIQAPVAADGPLGDESDAVVVTEVRDAVEESQATGAQVQVATEGDQRLVLVQTKEIEDPAAQEELVSAVREAVGASPADTDSSRVGSKWGSEITDKALRALVIFILVIVAFISWRFEWKMALAAVAALIHDLLITAGIYAGVGFEVTPSTVIAILTILGYSLYDTVVVFDKVEENTSLYAGPGRMTYEGAANVAMNQVFMRSLNTSLTTLLPVAALLFVGVGLLGASTLKDLALALLVGILSGTYSSIFLATPLLSMVKEHEPRYRGIREKVLREARKEPVADLEEPELVGEVGASAVAVRKTPGSRPVSKPRVGSKKKKRRKR
jgi:preprotein translocase subunit SecF